MNSLLQWLAKFFGHIPVDGTEALMIKGLEAALVLLVVHVVDMKRTPTNADDCGFI